MDDIADAYVFPAASRTDVVDIADPIATLTDGTEDAPRSSNDPRRANEPRKSDNDQRSHSDPRSPNDLRNPNDTRNSDGPRSSNAGGAQRRKPDD